MEKWKKIDISQTYEVSTYGRIRRINKWPKRFGQYSYLKPNGSKYPAVRIEGKTYNLHKLIALTFLPNPKNYKCVMHLDNDTYNNNINNLQWGSHSMNITQCVREGRWNNQFTK
jgi:hypothetical protein